MDDQNQKPTHFAVPIPLFNAVVKTLGTMPYEQVSGLMLTLSQCQALHMKQDVKPGDNVPPLHTAPVPAEEGDS